MADEPNFLDLVALSKITPDLVVEKFGGRINSSFFDGSNILGTLRLKGLIDFTANFPGQSTITITDTGRLLLKEASDKASAPFDPVDLSILMQLQAGKRAYLDIGSAVNLRPKDTAMHLYKLTQQQYSVYEIRNGILDVMLTEKGLMQAKAGMPMQPGMAPAMAPQMAAPMAAAVAPAPQDNRTDFEKALAASNQELEDVKQLKKTKDTSLRYKWLSTLIVFIVCLVVVLVHKGILKI